MKVAKLSEVPRQSMSRATKFFHGAEHVSRQGLTDESTEVSVNVIHFDHGAHTHMHIHGCDQVLLVTKGKGFVETEQERHELSEGDVGLCSQGREASSRGDRRQGFYPRVDHASQLRGAVFRRLVRVRSVPSRG